MPIWSVRNESYWSHLDYIFERSQEPQHSRISVSGLYRFECGDQGWCAEMHSQTDANMTGYGQWLGNRYANQGNIVWVHGGDAKRQ